MADLFGVLGQQREFVEARQFVVGDFRHGSTLHTTEIQVLFERRCVSVNCMSATAYAPSGLTIRTAGDADWSAMGLVAATCFGDRRPQETTDMWRTMMPEGSAVVACDGADVVGMAAYVDLELTVPGGAVLPMAGVTWVAVSPTHRRRGVLRAMFAELHGGMGDYPIAGLQASEAGIYGRFGYGPAMVEHKLTVDRREARLHAEVPDPGGVRIVEAAAHREQLADIWERWRLQTPGGLHSPPQMWDDLLADHEDFRDGGSAYFCLLHADGYVLYRTHGTDEKKRVELDRADCGDTASAYRRCGAFCSVWTSSRR